MEINEQFRVYNAATLGQALKHFREEAGLTQGELAARLGMRQPYLSKIEAGKATPRTNLLIQILREVGARIVVVKADW
jgi:HTH-type transcriptional regulator/antitoxin HipB